MEAHGRTGQWNEPDRQTKRRRAMANGFGIMRGVNLGGWLSQCSGETEHLDTFIREEDIARIASWGMDHVRLPVDYDVLARDDGFDRVDEAIGWCRKNGLKLVLDLHKTAGFSFDAGENESGFFDSADYQEQFYSLWERLAARFGSLYEDVAFELLNEVTDYRYMATWNRIAVECIRRIRPIAPQTWILFGGYDNNAPYAVPTLEVPDDERIILNLHCYMPVEFTHQGAYWVPWLNREDRVSYEASGATEEYFEGIFHPAVFCAWRTGRSLYCGEYGVIDIASPEDTLRWYRAIHAVFERHGIARCAWSYKAMDFGLGDPRMDGVRDELIKLL
uniref:Cellodextrinase n=1 Tax=uncultured microorganism TaxID=358574 RepID=B1PLK5_9ZZZZ|nr:cellodextrinase [uncultured microorganism]